MGLEELAQYAVRHQLRHDQQMADASVAIERRVDGLELHVGERRLDQRRHGLGLVVEEAHRSRPRAHRVRPCRSSARPRAETAANAHFVGHAIRRYWFVSSGRY
jgi:hypothetical protein